jgi:LytS/YehU family sensor histidine kinase
VTIFFLFALFGFAIFWIATHLERDPLTIRETWTYHGIRIELAEDARKSLRGILLGVALVLAIGIVMLMHRNGVLGNLDALLPIFFGVVAGLLSGIWLKSIVRLPAADEISTKQSLALVALIVL